jgi:Intracellular proteinase inhibitor
MPLQTLFKQLVSLAFLERSNKMRGVFYILVIFFLTGCSLEDRSEAESIVPETEVKEVKNGELDLNVSIYHDKHTIQFIITLKNNTNEMKKVEFPTSQKYEIIIKNKNDKEVYRYSKGKMFTQAIETALIKSGESMEWEEVWEHSSLAPGEYTAEITILAPHTVELKKEESFQISEESEPK